MYENRYVLFLDILGFKKIIEETENEKGQTEKIENLIEALTEMKRIVSRMPKKTSKIVTQFSDSIVVSFKEDDVKEIPIFLTNIHKLIANLAMKNIFCRGAISYGKIYHTKDFVFGPALVDAYLTESEAAIYPRVIFDKSIIDIMKNNYSFNKNDSYRAIRFDGTIESYLKFDLDDKLYVDFFSRAAYYYRNEDLFEYYKSLRKSINNGLKFKSPGIKAKFGWMKNKYNKLASDFLKADEEEEVFYGRPDIQKFVNEFKKI
ncbi:hypothetical protein [Lutibacter flavus]|uniref:Guanylate cyclase domain-containing protein n=1 Tax=Lutibacter flavus TaxID=691689 RepID=A0A238Y717_9FLAO|nr:hypothetical protein [Lutibacter flavus]SNR67015.1 hypothetical protein SAMN04488111_2347 [Lutibacter flavus]